MSDAPEFERITYRVEWVFMIGTIGDSEGRTWAKDLIEEKRFATKTEAEAYRDTHPGLELSQWGSWKTKHSYGQFAIVRQEVRTDLIPDPLDDPRVKALMEAVQAEIEARNLFLSTAPDRGGRNDTKGQRKRTLENAQLDTHFALRAILAALEGGE